MGASVAVAVALIFLGLLIAGTLAYSSAEYSNSLVKKAQYDQDTMKKAKMQTDITITNVTNKTTYLNITLKNTGKTTLNASALDVFVDGIYYNYTLLSSSNTWTPENKTNITTPVILTYDNNGHRIKVISENGISDYMLVP